MMEISSLPISASHRAKLLAAGYSTLSSLSSVSPLQLGRDLNITPQEAFDILNITSGSSRLEAQDSTHEICKGAQTAWDMLSEEKTLRHISTGSGELDTILGGGLHCKEVTEIEMEQSIWISYSSEKNWCEMMNYILQKLGFEVEFRVLAKRNLGRFALSYKIIACVVSASKMVRMSRIQLAINVQIPCNFGGLGGKAVYIDTEGSFMAERAYQIAEACIMDTLDGDRHQLRENEACLERMKPDTFLANIFYFRICSYTEQIAVINYLDQFVADHKDVKIVIIDSVTFHFRQDFSDLPLRTRVLGAMSLKLMSLAKRFNLAVVLMNQVATKFTEGSFQLTLALGDSWSHSCTNRVILYWNGNERHAYLDKSPYLRPASAPFSVTSKGIRDAILQCKRVRMM